jgi:hypothetical protein
MKREEVKEGSGEIPVREGAVESRSRTNAAKEELGAATGIAHPMS